MFSEHIARSGRTQADWARQLEISPAYLSMLVAGKKRPSLSLAAKIEDVTGGAVTASSWMGARSASVSSAEEDAA